MKIGGADAVASLLEMLCQGKGRDRNDAARALHNIEDPNVVPGLLGALRHEDSVVRALAADSLGWIGQEAFTPELVGALIEMLNDADEEVRKVASSKLTWIRTPEAREALKRSKPAGAE